MSGASPVGDPSQPDQADAASITLQGEGREVSRRLPAGAGACGQLASEPVCVCVGGGPHPPTFSWEEEPRAGDSARLYWRPALAAAGLLLLLRGRTSQQQEPRSTLLRLPTRGSIAPARRGVVVVVVGCVVPARPAERGEKMKTPAATRWCPLLLLLPLLLCAVASGQPRLLGAPVEAAANDAGVQQALRFALDEYNKASNDKYRSRVAELVRAQKQVSPGREAGCSPTGQQEERRARPPVCGRPRLGARSAGWLAALPKAPRPPPPAGRAPPPRFAPRNAG